jgi:hypothetical protein
MKRPLFFWVLVFFAARFLSACAALGPAVVEEAVDPDSPARKVAAYHVHKWTSKPITLMEKHFDFNKNGVLDPEEQLRLKMARGFYRAYGNVWRYDKNKDWQFDQEEFYDAGGGNQ